MTDNTSNTGKRGAPEPSDETPPVDMTKRCIEKAYAQLHSAENVLEEASITLAASVRYSVYGPEKKELQRFLEQIERAHDGMADVASQFRTFAREAIAMRKEAARS